MKKAISIILCLFILISVVSAADQTVYITKTGSKYHLDGCSSLSSSKIPIPLSEAIEQGYEPCSRCNPLTMMEGEVSQVKSITLLTEIGDLEKLVIPYCENPEDIVHHSAYSLLYSEENEQAFWVAYVLTVDELNGPYERTDDYRPDPSINSGSAIPDDYDEPIYDQGHIAPAEDMTFADQAMSESFYLSNMSPQTAGFNRGIWRRLENWVRKQVSVDSTLCIIAGPVLIDGPYEAIGENKVSIPKQFYKVVLSYSETVGVKGIGFLLDHESSPEDLSEFAHPIYEIEEETGLNFFPLLEDGIEKQIENMCSFSAW